MVKNQFSEPNVKHYLLTDVLAPFGHLLTFPPVRKLQKRKLALIKHRMTKRPYFGPDLLPDFNFGSDLEKAQKKAAQKSFALSADIVNSKKKDDFVRKASDPSSDFFLPVDAPPERVIEFLKSPDFELVSPRSLYVALCKARKVPKDSVVLDWLNKVDYHGDPTSVLHQSEGAEKKLGALLTSFGIAHKTQNDLIKQHFLDQLMSIEDTASRLETCLANGLEYEPVPKPVMVTPDFLFVDSVVVKSGKYHQVKWIEYKNQLGMKGPLYSSTLNQIQKYVKKWGPGAIVYSLGIVEDFSFDECPECIILDFYLDF